MTCIPLISSFFSPLVPCICRITCFCSAFLSCLPFKFFTSCEVDSVDVLCTLLGPTYMAPLTSCYAGLYTSIRIERVNNQSIIFVFILPNIKVNRLSFRKKGTKRIQSLAVYMTACLKQEQETRNLG